MAAITDSPAPGATTVEARIVAFFKAAAKMLRQTQPGLPKTPRPVHAKHHALVRAKFVVGDAVDAALRQGLFAVPGSYDAYVRFSNSGSNPDDGDEEDVRGAAIKVLGVEGPKLLVDEVLVQDFLLVDAPQFMARTPEEFEQFLLLRAAQKAGKISRADLEAKFPIFAPARRFIRNPLTVQYFSQTAYALGDSLSVKYHLEPCDGVEPPIGQDEAARMIARPNFLRQAMRETLAKTDVAFDFCVQGYIDENVTPVDDPTVVWPSRLQKVATLVIPAQDFEGGTQHEFGEQISFNPWHSLEAHRPLGRMNDVRLDTYLRLLANRREPNGQETFQPYP
jgi:catalase